MRSSSAKVFQQSFPPIFFEIFDKLSGIQLIKSSHLLASTLSLIQDNHPPPPQKNNVFQISRQGHAMKLGKQKIGLFDTSTEEMVRALCHRYAYFPKNSNNHCNKI